MSRFYKIVRRDSDDIGVLYALNLSGEASKFNNIKKEIQDESLATGSEIIMEIDPKTGTGKKRLGDFVYWQKGKPLSHVLIVSSRFLNFLKTLSIPEFKVYKIGIPNFNHDSYYILHVLGDIYDQIDYSRQIFYKENVNSEQKEGYLEQGAIVSKENFLKIRSNLLEKSKQALSFDSVVYKNEYDLIWGAAKTVLVNEETKKKIESQSFILDFEEFNEYNISFSFKPLK